MLVRSSSLVLQLPRGYHGSDRVAMDTFVTAIKQYPGQVQVTRSVKVKVPGKHFPQLQPSEQAQEQAICTSGTCGYVQACL